MPLPPWLLFILAALFVVVLVLVWRGVVQSPFAQLGLRPWAVLLLLIAAFVGQYFNVPVGYLAGSSTIVADPSQQGMAAIDLFAAQSTVPFAVNLGGALIPVGLCVYLLVRNRFWWQAALATAVMAVWCYVWSHPVAGLGILQPPVFLPATLAALVAMLLSRANAMPLAYVGATLGTLIGSDLLNLGVITGLSAPSIGGAGLWDGVFTVGIVAVLIAGLLQFCNRLDQVNS